MLNNQTNAESAYKTLVLLWFALLMSQIMFLVILYVLKPELFRFDSTAPILGENPPLILGFAAFALVNFALSFVMKNRAYRQAVEERKVHYVQTGLVLACALCEAISIIGLLLAFAFSYKYFYLWFTLGILGILLHFPRRSDVFAAS